MKIIVSVLVLLAFGMASTSYAQDKMSEGSQGQQPASKESDRALSSKPVGGSGVAGQPTAGGAKADSGVSDGPENPGSRNK